MIVGVLFTLDNLGLVNSDAILRFWPAALIVAGVLKVGEHRFANPRCTAGYIWIAVGVVLLLRNLHLLEVRDVFPLGFVVVGMFIVWQALTRGSRKATRTPDRADVVDAFALMGGVVRTNNSKEFKGGNLTAIMGGCEIDLRHASLSGGAVLETFAFWGGIEIRVPEDWEVVSTGLALMGGFDDQTRGANSEQRLEVRGLAIMGAVEIKN
jgi:hypothetical protein